MKKQSLVNKTSLAVSIAMVSGLMMAGNAQAESWKGGQSNAVSGHEYIEVDLSTVNGGPHKSGKAGIGVSSFPDAGAAGKIDFAGVAFGPGPVYKLSFPITTAPATHSNLGVFSFAKAGTGDVWFGEWSENGSTADDNGSTYNGRQVYYSGTGDDSSIPGSLFAPVRASYAITGINNQYSSTGVLSGQLNAAFYGNSGTLTGSMEDANGFKIDIGNAKIAANAAITGTNAVAFDASGQLAADGAVSGHFFNQQNDVAGITDFAGTQYDTAFGGTKN